MNKADPIDESSPQPKDVILVVDDIEDNRLALGRRLRRHGFEVQYAENGPTALRMVEAEKPSLILLDVRMPAMDGFEVLDRLREGPVQVLPPVIMLTAEDAPEEIARALEKGAVDYVTKPFDFTVLHARITTQLREAEKRNHMRNTTEGLKEHLQRLSDERTGRSPATMGLQRDFELEVSRCIARARTRSEQSVFLHFDIDSLSTINHAYGRSVGDRLIQHVLTLISSDLTSLDMINRSGGDSFRVLMRGCTGTEGEARARTIGRLVHQSPLQIDSVNLHSSVSVGVVPIDHACIGSEELTTIAEISCQTAKDRGKNQCYLYESAVNQASALKRDGHWVVKLKEAMHRDTLVLYGQPIIETSQLGAPISRYEVLLRMMEGSQIISPGEFLPAAAKHGLMVEIDRWVFDRTIRTLATLHSDLRASLQRISINLSGPSLASELLLAHIHQTVASGPISPRILCFEITETAAVYDLDRAIRFMHEMQELGATFALDDFGSGVSSFAYLKSLPVNTVKIDGQFIKNIDSSPIDRVIVKSINEIAHIMGKETVAEFVQNAESIAELRRIGVDYLQGYSLGKPQPLDALLNHIPGRKIAGVAYD